MENFTPSYKKQPSKNHLPVPALIWVPAWLLGIICASLIDNINNYLFISLIVSILLMFKPQTRLISIIIISFIGGNFYFLSNQKKDFQHISHYLTYQQVDSLETKDYIQQNLTGKIISHRHQTKNSNRYILEIMTLADIDIQGKIYLYSQDSLKYGDNIETVVKIQPFKTMNPGQPDFTKINRKADIYAFATHLSPIKTTNNTASYFMKQIHRLREYIYYKIDSTLNYSSPLAKSLILGERTYLNQYDKDFIYEVLPDSGLSHLFAVSGLHVGIIFLLVFSFLKFLRFNSFFAKIITLIVLILYAFICSGSETIVRAVIFFSLFFIAKSSSRLVSDWQIFFISLFFISLANPNLIFNPSLQFSFTAIGGIFIAKEINKKIKYYGKYKKLLTYLIIIIIINILISPLLIHYFQNINFNTIASNILGIPLISLLLPLFFMIIILPPFRLFILSAEFLTEIFNYVIQVLSHLPFRYTISFSLGEIICLYCLLCTGFLFLAYSKNKNKSIIFFILASIVFSIPAPKHNFKISFFNVSNADCCLVEFSRDDLLLIDTGDLDDKTNSISHNLIPYLKQNNYRKISKVILTHQHSDHYGGIYKLSKNLKIDTIFVAESFINSNVGKDLISYPYLKDTYIYIISDTLTYKKANYKIKFLHPDKDYSDNNENNNSLVCRLTYEKLSILFTGDIEKEAEAYIVRKYPLMLKSDILKVAHHGSSTSSSMNFLEQTNAKLNIISATNQATRGFPNHKTLENIEKLNHEYFVTNKDGAVIITQKQDNLFLLETYFTNKSKLIFLR